MLVIVTESSLGRMDGLKRVDEVTKGLSIRYTSGMISCLFLNEWLIKGSIVSFVSGTWFS